MSADLNALIPELQEPAKQLVILAGRAGVQPKVTSTLRSHTQQTKLYNAYLRGETQYPVAPPGTSAHEFGYAFDMICDTKENLHDLGSVWVSWGGKWNNADEVHFEYPGFSPSIATPQERVAPAVGGAFYELADFLTGFLPGIGQLQTVDWLVGLLDGNNDLASFYLQHPAEAIRDLLAAF